MKKELFALLAISGIVIMFIFRNANTSSTKERVEYDPKVLHWNLGSEVVTLDPQLNKDLYGGSIINNMYEGLFRYQGKSIVPAIAEAYTLSDDGLTYTFKLKETFWSDGSTVTAHDFEYAWKRALDPKVASEYAHKLYYLRGGREYHTGTGSREEVGVKAIDASTLVVELKDPTPYFLDLMTLFTYFPVNQSAVETGSNGAWAIDPGKIICNGPFVLKSFSIGDRIILEKNVHYWNAEAVKLDQIVIYQVSDAATSLTGYNNGEFDIIDSVPLAEIPRLMAEDPTYHSMPSLAISFFIYNTDVKPLDDKRVRQALSLAIDKKAIVETVTRAGEMPATGFTPPGLIDANGNDFYDTAGNYGVGLYTDNIKTAQTLLAEAGYPDGALFPEIELSFNTSETNRMIAEAIQEMWIKNLNIKVQLTNKEWAVFQESKATGNFEIARGSWFADYADPMSMLELWTSYNPINTSRWSSKAYDDLIVSAKTEKGQKRFDLLYQAQDLLMAEMPVLPMYYFTDLFMISKRVVGWEKTTMGVWYFGNVDIIETE